MPYGVVMVLERRNGPRRPRDSASLNDFCLYKAPLQGDAKNGAILSDCKYSENFMTELRRNIVLLPYSL